ncbi:putative glucose-6-phosphate 1-epimerase isoform X1 [Silene latifolia]|uniref:putative glucose-6-phosphate 1-epimerase isoform X1 n=2 Tax=Silene latifolia TaxID=37657 RepID=UPI003D783A45
MVLSLLDIEKKMTPCEEVVTLDANVGSVEKIKDKHGIEQVILKNSRGAKVRISLYGGQVLSWTNEQGEELLFMSSKAIFKPPSAIRGGIPICFPQFGSRGMLEQHGFARNRMWVIDDNPTSPRANKSNGQASTDLVLKPTAEDITSWPSKFEIRLRVTLTEEGNLILRSRVKNTNGKPLSFSIAFRTYFAISDISEVRVEGLETLDYLDSLKERERFTEQGDALTFESEIDRVYLSSSDVALFDHGSKKTFQIRKQGLPDVAVWNPWDKKAKAISDLGDDEYKEMLCVDGAVIEKPITLKPGEEWVGQLDLSVLSSC